MRTNPITFTIYKISYLMRNIFNLFNEMIFFYIAYTYKHKFY